MTGLLYINPKSKDLAEILNIVDKPLNALNEGDLCPGKSEISKINAGLK